MGKPGLPLHYYGGCDVMLNPLMYSRTFIVMSNKFYAVMDSKQVIVVLWFSKVCGYNGIQLLFLTYLVKSAIMVTLKKYLHLLE